MATSNLGELAKNYNLPQETIEKWESERALFTNKFPIEDLRTLPLDQFVQGTDDNSFCYWLEFKKIGFGIGGGNASKFGIYKTNKEGELLYVTGSQKSKKYLQLGEAKAYYTSLLDKIILALDYTKNDQIERIKELEFPMWNMVLQKILSIYYPDKFLAIGSPAVLIDCAQELNLTGIDLNPKNSIQINYECKKAISNMPECKDWSYAKVGEFVWANFKREKGESISGKQYWLYAPGENARNWEEFYEKGIMGLGWDKIGDLSQYQDRKELKQALVKAYGGDGSKANDVSANDDFLNKMKIGDIVIAKKGRGELLGYGIVTSDYEFDKERSEYQKVRKVDWKLKGSWKLDFNLVLKTLTDITSDSADHPDYDSYYEQLLSIMQQGNGKAFINGRQDINQHHPYATMNIPLNTILYGPPGTGKTYNSIDKAVHIATGVLSDHKKNKIEFDRLRKQGQIEFVTFHQNYTYEDFMVGIKPDIDNSNLRFVPYKGVFYQLCRKARDNFEASQLTTRLQSFDDLVEEMLTKISDDQALELKTLRGKPFWLTDYSDKTIYLKKSTGSEIHTLSISTLIEIAEGRREMVSGLGTYYYPIIEYLKLNRKTAGNAEGLKRYVLIIDEINRANISKVFGELITLLEDDKRLGHDNELRISLPNGEKDFGIPPNLYVIGTMNTADKSIALIDIALRRRFEFEGKYPDYSLVENPEAQVLLRKINTAVFEKKSSADYLIGHAYFMNNKLISETLKNKVIPLLMEYFMGKTGFVEDIFKTTDWKVIYNKETYSWGISKT